jgi:TRAP-type transport system periplasmic protein
MANRLMSLAVGLALSLAASPALAQFGAPGQASRGASQAPAAPELSPPPEITGDVVGGNLPSQTLKFGIGLAETSPQYRSVKYFTDILDKRTGGKLKVQIFPNSQVGDDAQMMQALQSGTLEMTYPSTSPAASLVPELQVFDLPFLFGDRKAAYAVMDSDLGQQLLDKFQGTGIKALAFAENGFRELTNKVRPVTKPADVGGLNVGGLKIRTMQNPVQVDIWKTLGANPTPMAFGEVFSAMEQGVIDGQENPWSTILTSNFFEVQPYGTETRHVYTPFIIMISQRVWDNLPEPYKQVVQEAADKSALYERKISAEYDDWAKAQLKERGMQVAELSPEQRAAFREATKPVFDQWAPRIGPDLVEQVQKIADGAEGTAAAQ